MGVLEQIMQMKNQGVPDEEIVGRLQENGLSPKMINDALNQAEIKKAVSGGYPPQGAPGPSQYQQGSMAQEMNDGQGGYAPQEQQQQYSPQEYAPQQGGYEEQQYQQGGGMDTSTIMEISEQVFSEKIQKIQKQLKEVSDFKVLAESNMNSFEMRLKRIENMIDKLQVSILEKVGSYGKGLENVEREMQMMQDSFGKMVNPLADKTNQRTSRQNYPGEGEQRFEKKTSEEPRMEPEENQSNQTTDERPKRNVRK